MRNIKNGFSSYQIKIIALIFMTLDHIAAYGSSIPLIDRYSGIVRNLGRIAAPLFLFIITESVQHTHNKLKFIIRLYLAGLSIGVCNILFSFIVLAQSPIKLNSNNIMFTFFYIALYIYLIELLKKGIVEKKLKQIILSIILILIPFLLTPLHFVMNNIIDGMEYKYLIIIIENLFISIFPNLLAVEYSILFILLGVLIYFFKTKTQKCIVFLAFCLLCYSGKWFVQYLSDFFIFESFFWGNQYFMVLALPFMLLYNGSRGKGHKLFFYLYYPLHIYIIMIINTLFI